MKSLLSLLALLAATTAALADKPKFIEAGDLVQIQAVQPLWSESNTTNVRVIDLSKDWVLVEYERPARGADGAVGKEKAQVWINFAHVISVRKVEAKQP